MADIEMQNGNALFYPAEWLAYLIKWWRFWCCSQSCWSFQAKVFPKNIGKLPTSNLDDESSIHGDNAHEMGIVEDNGQDYDNTGYESDTSLFKVSNLKLDRQVEYVADIQMSIISDNRNYDSDNNGKIHFL